MCVSILLNSNFQFCYVPILIIIFDFLYIFFKNIVLWVVFECTQQTDIGHQMVRRNDTLRNATESLMSPYLVRVIGPIERLDNTEKDVYYWIFHRTVKDR